MKWNLVANGNQKQKSDIYGLNRELLFMKPHFRRTPRTKPAAAIIHHIYLHVQHKGIDSGGRTVAELLSRVSNTNTQWAAGRHYFRLNVLQSEGMTQLEGHQLDAAMLIH